MPSKIESDDQRLMEMFPSESCEHVTGMLKVHGMSGLLDLLLQSKDHKQTTPPLQVITNLV